MGRVRVPDQGVSAPVKSVELSAVVTRADGTVEDQGTLAYWHRNPLRRLAAKLRRKG